MNFQPGADVFRPYLFSGERILWQGRPKQGLAFTAQDAWFIPISLVWGGFAIFWNFGVWAIPNSGDDSDWFLRLWGLPFLAMGLYFIVGRFFHDAWLRKRIFYAVTDRRVLIFRGRRSSKITSRYIDSLPMLELTEYRDGTGTIAFDSVDIGYSMFGRNRTAWMAALSAGAQFFRIDNPLKVYELIRDQGRSPDAQPHAPAPSAASGSRPG